MSWFDDVPLTLEVAGGRFLLAGEALEEQDRRVDPFGQPADEGGERPNPDWAASGLLLLARVQLDQMVAILGAELNIGARGLSGSDVARRLAGAFEEIDGVSGGDVSDAIGIVGEGVDLWRALEAAEGGSVGHGFAPDGSITITVGPDLPELPRLRIRPGDDGELHVSPRRVLERATDCTRVSAWLVAKRRKAASGRQDDLFSEETDSGVPYESAMAAVVESFTVLPWSAGSHHFEVWWRGSEFGFVHWTIALLQRKGLLSVGDPIEQARGAARMMSLWALHSECAGYSDGGSVGDWRYEVSRWVDDGISVDDLRLLNDADGLGWEFDEPEGEVDLDEICAELVMKCHREIADVFAEELGEAYTFVYFWATRREDVEYPVDPDRINQIVNEDLEDKYGAYGWVDAGMYL